MKTIITEAKQTVYDLAVEHYGTIEAVGELLALNPHLSNDPAALAAVGVDYITDTSFYIDVAVLPATKLTIDERSRTIKQNITREIKRTITTYGTNN